MPVGSPRPNAGRPKGAVNRKTEEAIKAAKATGVTPLEYLLSIMRDTDAERSERIDCAKAAAPYIHAKLSNIEATISGHMSYEDRLKALHG